MKKILITIFTFGACALAFHLSVNKITKCIDNAITII